MQQRQAGLFPGAQRAGGDGRGDVLGRGPQEPRVEGVEQQELVPQVQAEGAADVDGERVAAVVRVDRDRRAVARHAQVEIVVHRGGDLRDHVDPVGREPADRGGGVLGAVVDHVVRARGRRQHGLLRAAHRRDHRCPGPRRELDRGVADRARPALHEDELPGQGTRAKPRGPGTRGQRPVRGDGGNAEAGPEVERLLAPRVHQGVGQPHGPVPVEHAVLGRGAERQAALPQVDPDRIADHQPGHAFAEAVDHASAVLARGNLGERHGRGHAGPRLPVGGVHAGPDQPHPDLARTRLGNRPLGQPHDGGRTVAVWLCTLLRVHPMIGGGNMTDYGFSRVSTGSQDAASQKRDIKAASPGAVIVTTDTKSASASKGEQLDALDSVIAKLTAGDRVIVTDSSRLDRRENLTSQIETVLQIRATGAVIVSLAPGEETFGQGDDLGSWITTIVKQSGNAERSKT